MVEDEDEGMDKRTGRVSGNGNFKEVIEGLRINVYEGHFYHHRRLVFISDYAVHAG